MPLTKEYLRYKPNGNFNIITSPQCNPALVNLQGQEGRFLAVGACEEIIVWDLKIGEKALVLPGDKHVVTCLCASPSKELLAAGYSNGTIKLYNLEKAEIQTEFVGHKYTITCLNFDSEGFKLASGSNDTEIIIWDVVAECGIHRLSGHEGAITQIKFMSTHNYLVSSSKDTFIKFWDLDTAHCFHTLVGHNKEIYDFTLLIDDQYITTGTIDDELRIWKITFKNDFQTTIDYLSESGDNSYVGSPLRFDKCGSILRKGKGRVVSLISDNNNSLFACHGKDNCIELFTILNEDDSKTKKRASKRRKKEKMKMIGNEENINEEGEKTSITLKDQIERWSVINTSAKIKSIDLVKKGKEMRIAAICHNNTIEFHSLKQEKSSEPLLLKKITSHGHHSEVRALAFSSDNQAIASASADSVKVWNRPSLTCIRTIPLDNCYSLSLCFAPGDRHLLVGLKDGRLLIIDIACGDIIEDINAHKSHEIWSVSLTPDQHGCVTGGGDKTVKFWRFELVEDPQSQRQVKVLSLVHLKTLVLEESVLACKISPNNRFVAVSLYDSTVKVFYLDTLKFSHVLYGHKLPVLCLDISHDSKLIVTGSADRNIRLWGLGFADCHKSLFAHEDSVTAVQFVNKTKLFFSCGKDGKIKQWDGESFDKILTLQGHQGEARTLTISPNGQHLISCGSDQAIRHYEKTSEPLVLEDEAEEERAREDQEELVTGAETNVLGAPTLHLPSRKTAGSEKAAEDLIECVSICKKFLAETNPSIPPLMQAYGVKSPQEFLLHMLSRIKSSELEESLLILPLDVVYDLLKQISLALDSAGHRTELLCRVMILLFKVHHGPIVTSQALLPDIMKLKSIAFEKINYFRDLVGVNLHGLDHIKREIEEKESILLFQDATIERRHKEKRRKGKEQIAKRAIISL